MASRLKCALAATSEFAMRLDPRIAASSNITDDVSITTDGATAPQAPSHRLLAYTRTRRLRSGRWRVARGEPMVTECAQLLDGHLAVRRWIAQDRLILADLAIAAPLMQTAPARLPV